MYEAHIYALTRGAAGFSGGCDFRVELHPTLYRINDYLVR
jgi:hypothetical protein